MSTKRDERGAVAIMAAVMALALFMCAALVVDLGLARDTKQRSQVAADASALAAANALYPDSGVCTTPVGGLPPCLTDAVVAAQSYAAVNYSVDATEWATCPAAPSGYKVPSGAPTCISFDDLAAPTRVWAVMPTREVDTGMGNLAGVSSISVGTRAQARVDAGVEVECALCFLGPFDSGNADYEVYGGSIAVNGNVTFTGGGTANVTATGGGIYIAGTWELPQNFSPAPTVSPSFTDPLAGLALPVGTAGLTVKTQPCATTTKVKGKNVTTPGEGPGIYGSVAITGQCDLEPGLYIITGQWSLKNNDVLASKPGGVTLYFTCGSPASPTACANGGEAGGQLFGKNGGLNLTARSANPIAGYAIVYDRNNTSSVQLQGNGIGTITGGIYAKSADLEFNGTSDFVVNGGPIVVDGIIKGNGTGSGVDILNANSIKVADKPGDIGLEY